MMSLYTHYFDSGYTFPVKVIVLSHGVLRVVRGENKPLTITEFDGHLFPFGSFHLVKSPCHQIFNRSGSLQVRYSVLQHRRYGLTELDLCFNFGFADSTERLGFECELQPSSLVGYWEQRYHMRDTSFDLLGKTQDGRPGIVAKSEKLSVRLTFCMAESWGYTPVK